MQHTRQYFPHLRMVLWAYNSPNGSLTYVLVDAITAATQFFSLEPEYNDSLITKWLSEGSQDVLTWEQCEQIAISLPECDEAGKEYWEASETIVEMTCEPYYSDHVRGL